MLIARKRKLIEDAVAEVLSRCEVDAPPVPVHRIAKWLGIEIKMEPFRDGQMSGILVREEGKAVIGVNSLDAPTRQRFTVAHEIGHFLLHEGNRIFVDRTYKVSMRSPLSSQGTDYEEIEANAFAGALLIPGRFLIKDLTDDGIDIDDAKAVARLARKYNVSPQAMSLRLINWAQ